MVGFVTEAGTTINAADPFLDGKGWESKVRFSLHEKHGQNSKHFNGAITLLCQFPLSGNGEMLGQLLSSNSSRWLYGQAARAF